MFSKCSPLFHRRYSSTQDPAYVALIQPFHPHLKALDLNHLCFLLGELFIPLHAIPSVDSACSILQLLCKSKIAPRVLKLIEPILQQSFKDHFSVFLISKQLMVLVTQLGSTSLSALATRIFNAHSWFFTSCSQNKRDTSSELPVIVVQEPWKVVYTHEYKPFFYNTQTWVFQWDHPQSSTTALQQTSVIGQKRNASEITQ